MTWVLIAFRNLRKNTRRSIFTTLAIALGFAAINLFGGFTEYIFTTLRDSFIYTMGNGHLMIFKSGYRSAGEQMSEVYMLSKQDVERIRAQTDKMPQVMLTTPKIHFSGMISNGEVSTVFLGLGEVPADLAFIRKQAPGALSRLELDQNTTPGEKKSFEVALGEGLARKVDLAKGEFGVMMTPTMAGQINAMDFEVHETFKAASEFLDDRLAGTPLRFAQSLCDTESVHCLCVLLNDTELTDASCRELQERLKQEGLDVEVLTWYGLSDFYRKVKDMFDIIFLFLFVIVLAISIMCVVNTISMAVLERTREVGTLRALGVKRRAIVSLFAIESMLLGVLGSGLGAMLTLAGWWLIGVCRPTWVPPQVSISMPLEVYLVPEYMLLSFLLLTLLSSVAAVIPARRAGRMDIVDALRYA